MCGSFLLPTILDMNIFAKTVKNGIARVVTGNVNLFCKTVHLVRFKIISLYIYKDLRLRILGLICHVAITTWMVGYLAPSPQCGFCFGAAFQL